MQSATHTSSLVFVYACILQAVKTIVHGHGQQPENFWGFQLIWLFNTFLDYYNNSGSFGKDFNPETPKICP